MIDNYVAKHIGVQPFFEVLLIPLFQKKYDIFVIIFDEIVELVPIFVN